MDINHPFYEQYQSNLCDWGVDHWLKINWIGKLGVRSSDFNTHPSIDDVVTLLQIRESLWDRMNYSEQATWGAYWNIAYHKKRNLNKKFWNKFTKIANNIHQREVKQQIQRQLIQRRRNIQNTDHNKDAKGSNSAQMLTDKSNNEGATMNLLPWE